MPLMYIKVQHVMDLPYTCIKEVAYMYGTAENLIRRTFLLILPPALIGENFIYEFLSHAHTQGGKVISSVVVVVDTKIAKS